MNAARAVSRAWFVADLLAGRLGGARCPSCGHHPADRPVRRAARGLVAVWRCARCGLLFRPVGFSAGVLSRFYYSYLYASANLATDVAAADCPEALEARMGHLRRGALLRDVAAVGHSRPVVYVLGCSWGYEVRDLRRDGYVAVGIEVGARRRELGRRRLGVPIYPTLRAARAAEPPPDIVLSSHVLEHVARLESYLDTVAAAAPGAIQVHITPGVEHYPGDASERRLVGREHPIGVTTGFWTYYAARRDRTVCTNLIGYRANETPGELVAVLRASG
jgi:hypothetical protein